MELGPTQKGEGHYSKRQLVGNQKLILRRKYLALADLHVVPEPWTCHFKFRNPSHDNRWRALRLVVGFSIETPAKRHTDGRLPAWFQDLHAGSASRLPTGI